MPLDIVKHKIKNQLIRRKNVLYSIIYVYKNYSSHGLKKIGVFLVFTLFMVNHFFK